MARPATTLDLVIGERVEHIIEVGGGYLGDSRASSVPSLLSYVPIFYTEATAEHGRYYRDSTIYCNQNQYMHVCYTMHRE